MGTSLLFFVFVLFIVIGTAILSITGCKKETISSNSIPAPFHTSRDYTPPTANAGPDVLVFLPGDSCKLYGWASSRLNGLESNMWRKVSGPSSVKISTPNSFQSGVNDLIRGVYEFELMVTDNVGLTNADTVTVTVEEMPIPKIVIKNVYWGAEGPYSTLYWGAVLTVKNIYSHIPVGSTIKVFISNEFRGAWVQALEDGSPGLENALYHLFIVDSNLYVVSGYDEVGTADIMIY